MAQKWACRYADCRGYVPYNQISNLTMNSVNLSKKNPLGRVFWTLPKELREQIFVVAITDCKIKSRHNLRQYFFVNAKHNPEKLDSHLKGYMIRVCPKFKYCFVPNSQADRALEQLAEAA
ncbi:hypothetical protein VB796_06745 [Arcicella sp. LKC2W]|uniref:hypothetical protein n=1 Tax=Arcicella sp. LKC2W TaxID=2984198 RepID=UPI002B20FDB8|nr:hypothetical protein [Arcicella sp. LKC2W]MEA5458725.1 hypothetical protein [Arcicella sp. LKC2W]